MMRVENDAAESHPMVPVPLIVVFLCGFGFVAWDQSYWWRTKEDYGFGWLTPLFVAYVLHLRWAKLKAAFRACNDGCAAVTQGRCALLWRVATGCSLAAGAVLFLAGSWYRASFGASHMGTLCITLGVIAMVAACLALYLNIGYKKRSAPDVPDHWTSVGALLVFPLFAWLLSAPLLSGLENLLNRLLLENIMALVAAGFQLLGLDFQREGSVIVTPGGRVGILDACAGIRSLVGCLFAGAFLGAALLERLSHKLALLAAAVVLSVAANLARAVFLAWAVHRHGMEAVEGVWHDLAGWAVLCATVGGLFLIVFRLRAAKPLQEVSGK